MLCLGSVIFSILCVFFWSLMSVFVMWSFFFSFVYFFFSVRSLWFFVLSCGFCLGFCGDRLVRFCEVSCWCYVERWEL